MSGPASPFSLLVVALVSGVTAAAVTHVSTADANPSGVSGQTPTLPTQAEPTGPHSTAQLHGKWSLYEVENTGSIGANAMAVVVVKCNDADDIPVANACQSNSGGTLIGTRFKNWTSIKKAAESQCTFWNGTGGTVQGDSTMVCQRVNKPKE